MGAAASSAGAQLLNIAGMLAVVVILIVVMAWGARQLMGGSLKVGRHIQVLEVFPLGRNEKLCLARVGGRTLLLGITPQRISPIESWKDWPEAGEDALQGQSQGEFQKILSRLVKSS